MFHPVISVLFVPLEPQPRGCQINTLRPRQNGRHFADDIFKWIFLNKNVWIPIEISLKFVPQGPINNIPALVQIMAWRRPGDKPFSGPMMVRLPTHICVTRPQWDKNGVFLLRGNTLKYTHFPMCSYAIGGFSVPIVFLHSPLNKMADICQTTFSNEFVEIVIFREEWYILMPISLKFASENHNDNA